MAMYRFSESTSTRGYGSTLNPSDVTAAITGLLTSGTRTVHVAIGRPDLLGLLRRGPLLQAIGASLPQIACCCACYRKA
jgi:hypothetical protein